MAKYNTDGKMLSYPFLLICIASVLNLTSPAPAQYAGGTGDPNNPYLIAEPNDLVLLSQTPTDWDKHFILTVDIDMSEIASSYYPIGNTITSFCGVFDGNNHIISNATIILPTYSYIGLFGRVCQDGKPNNLKNLGVVNVEIYGKNYVGGLVGHNTGRIMNCYVSGSIGGNGDYIGGLVGYNRSSVTSCYVTGSVSGHLGDVVGGLVGYNTALGYITNCYVTGSVSSYGNTTGGLVGNNASNITNCYASSLVNGEEYYTGGLVGYNSYGNVTDCYATGSVSGDSKVGGLIGKNGFNASIANCYSTGAVSGIDYVGGLIGENSANESFRNCFLDTETSGHAASIYGEKGKTTTQMMMLATFTNAGWDFVGESTNGTEDIWAICEGTNYPKLVWQIPASDVACPDGVNYIDYSFFQGQWMNANCAVTNDCNGVDLDLSGAVGIGDLILFSGDWMMGLGL